LSVNTFLMKKIRFSCRIISILNFPILAINTIFQPDMMGFNAVFFISFLIIASAMVFIKYADYTPNEMMGFKVEFIVLCGGIFLPYLIPLSILMVVQQRKKALQNLNYYLHA
jgi:hypothetical protein